MRNCLRYLTLMLCLMLTACGGSRDEPPQGQVSLLEKPAEMEEETILLTVDGREVETWQYLYWLRQACETIAAEYEAAGMNPDWAQQTESGTLADYAKAQALSDAALYATVENWAEQYGCTAETTVGEAENGLTARQSAKLSQVGQLYGALYTVAFTPESELCPSEAEVETFAAEEGWIGFRQIRIPFDGDRETAQRKAAELFGRLNAAEDGAAEFSTIEEAAGVETLRLGEGKLPGELEDALAGLEEGQFSGILEAEDAFVLLLRQKAEERMVREAFFDHQLLKAAEAAEIRCTSAYQTLDVASFWREIHKENE